MKQHLTQLLTQAASELCRREELPSGAEKHIQLERTRDAQHGDFASNAAMVLGKLAKRAPREIAEALLAALPQSDVLEKAEIAAPGFINFFLTSAAYRAVIDDIRRAGKNYGESRVGVGQKVLVEFVSANPTGPLHVGHGRGAAYGDAVTRVLRAAGYEVESEYYINDAGRQVDILALSVWLRYLETTQKNAIEFPTNAYQGGYIRDIAADLHAQHGDAFKADTNTLFMSLSDDNETRLDELIERCKNLLGETYQLVFEFGCDALVEDIRQDLMQFGVNFDRWFSERSLLQSGDITRALATLEDNGYVYEKDGAKWFKASEFGDEKDRAVMRANDTHTYFASDIAYHFNKGTRGYDKLVNVFGADHHGYAQRIMASYQALGHERDSMKILLVQFAALYRGGKKVQMSTRTGEFVTLRELREEVGNDAARFFYVSRKNDQHMDFDLDLAKTQSADNPVYYIQYAHARICSVFNQLAEKNLPTLDAVVPDYDHLVEAKELELMQTLSRFPEVVEQAAAGLEPHQLAYYLRDLANDFHTYYNAHPFLASEDELRQARLGLIDATRQVIANGLTLLGVNAPERMSEKACSIKASGHDKIEPDQNMAEKT